MKNKLARGLYTWGEKQRGERRIHEEKESSWRAFGHVWIFLLLLLSTLLCLWCWWYCLLPVIDIKMSKKWEESINIIQNYHRKKTKKRRKWVCKTVEYKEMHLSAGFLTSVTVSTIWESVFRENKTEKLAK